MHTTLMVSTPWGSESVAESSMHLVSIMVARPNLMMLQVLLDLLVSSKLGGQPPCNNDWEAAGRGIMEGGKKRRQGNSA